MSLSESRPFRFRDCGFILSVALTGCSTFNATNCVNGQWQSMAFVQGQAGNPKSETDLFLRNCEGVGATLNHEEFLERYHAGLKEYCKAENGFRQGEKGRNYHQVCPADIEPAFLAEYERGYAEYRARKRIENLQRVDGSGRDQTRASSSPGR